jgi:uncharacterized protein YaeQ
MRHETRHMALPATLLHFDLRVVHADQGIEQALSFKVARHPSETTERTWLRVLAFAWKWRDGLAFGPGLCEPEAPDLLAATPDGRASLVVRVGKPEPSRVERDVNQNAGAEVAVLFESPRRLEAFLSEAREGGLARLARAELAAADPALVSRLAAREDRRFKGSITLVSDHLYIEVGGEMLEAPLTRSGY